MTHLIQERRAPPYLEQRDSAIRLTVVLLLIIFASLNDAPSCPECRKNLHLLLSPYQEEGGKACSEKKHG